MVFFEVVSKRTRRGGGGCLVEVPNDVPTKLGLVGFRKIQAGWVGIERASQRPNMASGTPSCPMISSVVG
jgi:hypothetical protein